MTHALAIDGGPKAVAEKLPTFLDAAGRTFGTEEERLVIEVLRSGCLSRNGGAMVERLERDFATALGVPHAIACSTGTAAVHLALAALDLEPGDEVIVPPITDIGSILPVLWQNAVPVFADVDPVTLCLDPEDLASRISPRTRAVIAVHLAGQPCDMPALTALCRRHGFVLIEDCSQAYWAECHGQIVGTMGDLACFSLQQSKHMTCGEGGLLATPNHAYAARARLFADKAWPRDLTSLGSMRFLFLAQNYRMSELQGAVALAQLGKLQATLACRRRQAAALTALLEDVPEVQCPRAAAGTTHSFWLYMLRVNEERCGARTADFGTALLAEGVPSWVQYIVDPLYLSPLFTERHTYGASEYPFRPFGRQVYDSGLCPRAEHGLRNVIALWWNEAYTDEHVRQIASAIRKVARHFSRAMAR
ncbi:MAG: aminotransferase class V-fold PLP-dependent enzyme [Luteitalea sp.]|nr:aminotransferase class V-fold PLP-dependent enzyme [Luteitalea sp.]